MLLYFKYKKTIRLLFRYMYLTQDTHYCVFLFCPENRYIQLALKGFGAVIPMMVGA